MSSNYSRRLRCVDLWVALLLGGSMLTACRQQETSTGKEAAPKAPISLTVVTAERRPMDRKITAVGSLVPTDRATLSIKTTGRLKTLTVDIGSPVKAGDVLAQIEPRDYELRLQQSAAFLAQARARVGLPFDGSEDQVETEKISSVKEAAALLEEASRTLERVGKLRSAEISSQSDLERAVAEHQVTLNRYQGALQDARERQAVLAQRRAEYEIARQQLNDTSLRAPFDGLVQARLTNVGEYLTSGSPVLTVVQVDPLRLRIELPERQAPLARVGQSVRMTLDGDTNTHPGTLARVSPGLDDRTRMLLVEAEFKNPEHRLRPGAFARAEILVEEASPTLAVPSDALVTFAGMEKVFLCATNRALERRVTSGRREGGWVEILQGIKPGDRVVRNPGGLRTGDQIQPLPDSSSPAPGQISATSDHAKAR